MRSSATDEARREAPDLRATNRWVRGLLFAFALVGFGFGSWLSRLPAVRDHLGASTLEMSFYGLALALGSVTGLLLSSRIISLFGTRRTLYSCVVLQCLVMPAAAMLLWFGFTGPGLALLFLYGWGYSTTDVAVNVSGANAERVLGKPRVSLLHGGYSLGTVTAMGIGALAEVAGVAVPVHLGLVFTVVAVGALLSLQAVPRNELTFRRVVEERLPSSSPQPTVTGPIPIAMMPEGESEATDRQAAQRGGRSGGSRVLVIGLITLAIALAEGIAADWLPLALADGRGIANETGALILGLFYIAMTTTRLLGGPIITRFGRVAVLSGGAIMCAFAIIVTILVPWVPGIAIAAVLWGAGCALGFPVGVSAAADYPETAVRDVARVSAIAYSAFLLGPISIGFLGEYLGLLTAFWPVAVITLISAAFVGWAREPEGRWKRP